MLNIDLTGHVALITGGAGGIGKGISQVLAQCGATVAIHYFTGKQRALELADSINKEGGKALTVGADICDLEDVKKMCTQVGAEFGKVDILINNAGITIPRNVDVVTYEEWEKVISTNLDGAFYVTKELLPFLKQSSNASIVNISSTSAITGGGHGPQYAASKAALTGLTRNLAKALGPEGIRVNCIAPTLIETKMLVQRYPTEEEREKLLHQIPLRRIGKVQDVGYLAAFLVSDLGSFITGQELVLDGGRTFA